MDQEELIKFRITQYFDAIRAGLKPENKVRRAESIKNIAKNYEGQDSWILKFKNGSIVKNKFGKKLYFKFG